MIAIVIGLPLESFNNGIMLAWGQIIRTTQNIASVAFYPITFNTILTVNASCPQCNNGYYGASATIYTYDNTSISLYSVAVTNGGLCYNVGALDQTIMYSVIGV